MDSSIITEEQTDAHKEAKFAEQKLKHTRVLYLFMLGLLITGASILIVYKYQNQTVY